MDIDKFRQEVDLAPDANDPGDLLAEELVDLVTTDEEQIVPDEVDQPPNPGDDG